MKRRSWTQLRMRQLWKRVALSALYDGEPGTEVLSAEEVAAAAEPLGWFRGLSELLRVPADVGEDDAGFIVRFRLRRDALMDEMAQPWRWLTLRLLPVTACTLLIAGLVVWVSDDPSSSLSGLEITEIGDGVADITRATAMMEPVLRIALNEL